MRVLVTGGAGFIGSSLVRRCLEAGDSVIAIDNLVNGKRENLEDIQSDRFRLEVADIRHTDRIAPLLEGVDCVFHLACLGVRHSVHSPKENHDVNASATLSLLELCRNAEVPRFVYVSTSEVYGTARSAPMPEDHPTYPMTVYGAAKLAGECYTRAYFETYDYPTVVIRPFNAYGPRCHHEGDSGEVIPKFILRSMAGAPMLIFGDGTQTRDFTFVDDTARGIMTIGKSPKTTGRTLNLGSGKEITINDLARLVAEVTGSNDPKVEHLDPRPGDVLRLCADNSLVSSLTDFVPQTDFQDGLTKLVAWYREQDVAADELLRDEVAQNWIAKN